jgi:peptide chain release factor 1
VAERVSTPTDDALAEHAELEAELADPAVHADQARARELGRRYAELGPLVAALRQKEQLEADLEAAREMAADGGEGAGDMAAEAEELARRLPELDGRIRELLVPRDPADAKDVILEVKAGEGGDESALFAGDLVRMYTRYAERQGWRTEVVSATEGELGGYKDVQIAVKSRDAANPVYGKLKFEGGVHRVQRVPVTESQGRIHTSAAGVLVLPEAEEVDVTVDQNDLRIDVYRSSGPGGQSVNTTDSAVRITHLPTGVVVSMQNEKSQLQNKEAGMRVLRARLLALALEEQAAKDSAVRGAQIRTVDRSEKVRTYNFPDNRVADHRSGYKANNLSSVLDGDLDPVIASLQEMDTRAKLEGSSTS